MYSSIRRKFDRGFILVTVLWMALGLLLGASTLLSTVRSEVLVGRSEAGAIRAEVLARNALALALEELSRPPLKGQRSSPRDGRLAEFKFENGRAQYRIWDEQGKVNLTKAPIEMLRPVLARVGESLGFDAFTTSNLAERIVEERLEHPVLDTNVVHFMRRYGFIAEDEMELARFFTMFSFNARLNPRHAQTELLEAIPGIGPTDIRTIISRREARAAMPRLGSASKWLQEKNGPVYSIEAIGTDSDGMVKRMLVIVLAKNRSIVNSSVSFDLIDLDVVD